MEQVETNLAIVGAGYWGKNLIRNAIQCPLIKLVAVCDSDAVRRSNVLRSYPGVEQYDSMDEILGRDDIDAVAIATPVDTHAPLALSALRANKHVLVEKPLASSVSDGEIMVATAKEMNRVLMVDHTFLYSPPVQKMKQLIDSGELGDIYFIDSVRINLGLFQHDVNVVWDLAPHDLSIVDYLLARPALSVAAFGSSHNDHSGLEDVAYLNLDLGDGLVANFHVNWLSPVKIRRFMLGGSKKSVVYNDLEAVEKIKVYDCGISVSDDIESRTGVLVGYRTGDVWSPNLSTDEPLQSMMTHFAQCVMNKETPISDGESGLRVLRILDGAQSSIKSQGTRVFL